MPHPAVIEREKRARQEEGEELAAKRLRSLDRLAAKLGIEGAEGETFRLLEALVLVEEGEPVILMAETMAEATELSERLLGWTTDLGIRDRLDSDVIFPRARSELLESAELSARIFKF